MAVIITYSIDILKLKILISFLKCPGRAVRLQNCRRKVRSQRGNECIKKDGLLDRSKKRSAKLTSVGEATAARFESGWIWQRNGDALSFPADIL